MPVPQNWNRLACWFVIETVILGLEHQASQA
jgi:hypothetical protein